MTAQRRREKTSKNNNVKSNKPSLDEQLNKAEVIYLRARETTHKLHFWWRKYLFGMSFIVLFFSYFQVKQPINECMESLKAIDQEIMQYSGFETYLIIAKNSICEIIGLLMLGCLTSFLSQNQTGKLSDPSFICATFFVPLQIIAFFNNREMKCQYNYLIPSSLQIEEEEAPEGGVLLDRPFPISLVFYVIMTLSCCFMMFQMNARNKDITAVGDLRKELTKAQEPTSKQKKTPIAKKADKGEKTNGTDSKKKK